MSSVPNPWAADAWNLTEQGAYIKKYGVEVAKRKARQAGTTLGALPPREGPFYRHLTIIQKRGANITVGGGGLVGAGSSGDGDPT